MRDAERTEEYRADQKTLFTQLMAEYGDGDPWKNHNGVYEYEGESADGELTWEITDQNECTTWNWSGYLVKCGVGWYEQQGEADNAEELRHVMEGMKAASEAFNGAYQNSVIKMRETKTLEDHV
jgi:hypothetical protein